MARDQELNCNSTYFLKDFASKALNRRMLQLKMQADISDALQCDGHGSR
jgi:hypothetical protein